MSYTDTFGSSTVPSTESSLGLFSLSVNQAFSWRYNSADVQYSISNVMEVIANAVGISLNLPPANQVSIGEATLIRNTGANQFTVLDAAGGTLGTIAAGVAKLFYVKDNSNIAGTWSVLTFGTGTSSADAASLQGLGVLAIGASLNGNHPVVTTAAAYTVTPANRANLVQFTSGSVNCVLPTLAAVGNGFYFSVKNNGAGTVTFVPQGVETIDQVTLVPGDSLMVVAGATGWVTVGYGRSVNFNFTRLNKNLTGLGPGLDANISGAEAGNKIINFMGTPTGDVNVVFPGVSGVYYLSSALSTYTVYVKTASGTSVPISHGDSTVVVCDGVNVTVALSSSYASNITLPNGTVSNLPMKFAGSTTTGWYAPSPGMIGFVLSGAERFRMSPTYNVLSKSLYIGQDPLSEVWTGGNLEAGGFITARATSGAGITLSPGDTANDIFFDDTKNSSVHMKAGSLFSFETELGCSPAGLPEGWRMHSTGLTTFYNGIADASYEYSLQTTGFNITIPNQCTCLALDAAATLAAGTINFPAAPDNGQELLVSSTQIVTALTMSGNGKTLKAPLTTIAANGFARWKYLASTTTWIRVG